MTAAQRRRLAVLVARADTAAGMDKLVAWIEVYAERARVKMDVEPPAWRRLLARLWWLRW